jgi:hypothetical protein
MVLGAGCSLIDAIGGDDDDDGSGDGIIDPDIPTATIDDIRQQGPGPTEVFLEGAFVTYLANNGFFLQETPQGPGIFVFEGFPPGIPIGESVSMIVTGVSDFQGNLQIDGFESFQHVPVIQNIEAEFATPIDQFDQTPGPQHAARLISLTRARVEVQLPGANNFLLSSASNLNWSGELFSPVAEQIGLCPGTSFDLFGVVHSFNGTFQVQAFKLGDFRLVSNPCPSMPTN